jgi:hypothetical protein
MVDHPLAVEIEKRAGYLYPKHVGLAEKHGSGILPG